MSKIEKQPAWMEAKLYLQTKFPKANWFMIGFLSYAHMLAIVGLSYITVCKWQTLVFSTMVGFWSGIGVTGGLHRLWAHRSYKAHWIVRTFLMLMSSIAMQGSIYHWVRDHRVHHKNSETEADPHNAKRGFFFSHMGWLLVKKDPKVIEAGKKLDMSDLDKDPVVVFQKSLDPWFSLFMCFVFPSLVASYGWNESILASYFVAGGLRYVFILHSTWLVNSAAHLWGSHPYDPTINPAENRFVAVISQGEGWHNWHHAYPYDYAASELGADNQYNPTKMFIDFCAFVGLVKDRKRALNAWNNLKEKRMNIPTKSLNPTVCG